MYAYNNIQHYIVTFPSALKLQPAEHLQRRALIQLVKNMEIDEQGVHIIRNIPLLICIRNDHFALVIFNIILKEDDFYLIIILEMTNHAQITRNHEHQHEDNDLWNHFNV